MSPDEQAGPVAAGQACSGPAPVARRDLEAPGPGATIPPGAQRFLSAAVWRQLGATSTPRRGALLNAQERLRSLLFLISTYLPAHLVQQKLRRPAAGQVDGRLLSGSFLFSDVSGFTALSESLAAHADGAERLTAMINAYMSAMLRVLSQSGGILVKFAGDALLAYFPLEDRVPETSPGRPAAPDPAGAGHAAALAAGRAARAAWRMMAALNDLLNQPLAGGGSEPDPIRLKIKIGLGTGVCLAAAVGDQDRMEYFLLGGAVERMMAAESRASAGQVVCDAATARALEGQAKQELWQATANGAGFYTLQVTSSPPTRAGQGSTALPARDGLGDFEVAVQSRRARGALPWAASHHAVAAQMEVIVRQIEALMPFLAPELVERIIAGAKQRHLESEYRPAVIMFVSISGPEQWLPAEGAGAIEVTSAVRQATRLLDAYFRAMQRVVADHGGLVARVDPYGGATKMLVIFGAPVKHEDDTARAVHAALAMNEALADVNARARRRTSHISQPPTSAGDTDSAPAIRHRIGIHRGLTFAGQAGSNRRREYTVMGDDVNLAARLMGAAQWGQILVSRAVRDKVADRFLFAPLAPIQVKGKRHPVEIFEAQAERAALPASMVRPTAPLVGREAELSVGQKVIDQALAGQGGMLIIHGAPGVGKSCLAGSLAASAQERGARVLAVECRAYAAAPYAPWCALLHGLFDLPPPAALAGGDEPSRQDRLVAVLDRLGIDAARHGPALATLMGMTLTDPAPTEAARRWRGEPTTSAAARPALFARLEKQIAEDEGAPDPNPGQGPESSGGLDLWHLVQGRRRAATPQPGGPAGEERLWHRLRERVASRQQARLAEALAGAVQCAAAARPLVLLIDHAQWLDDASSVLLDLLAGGLAGGLNWGRVLVMVVGRLEGSPWLAPILERGEAAGWSVTTLSLEPLDAATSTQLARHWLGAAAVDEATAARLFRRSGGNPLFLQELARAMNQRQGSDLAVEESLDDSRQVFASLVLSRVDALPAVPREVVRVASVAGDVFRGTELDALLQAARADIFDELVALAASRPGQGPGGVACEDLSDLVAGDPRPGGAQVRDPVYTFRQSLVREVIYGSHSFATRRELHRALAECLAAKPGSEAALLAHHYELADLPQPAAACLLVSARRARALYAYGRAAADCERALSGLAELPPERHAPGLAALQEALRVEQGDAQLLAGDFEVAAQVYRLAVRSYEDPEPAPADTGSVVRGSSSSATPAYLLWRLALALAGSQQAAAALARAEQAWAAASSQTARAAAEQAIDRLAAAVTLAWLGQRAAHGQAAEWLERARALGSEAGGEELWGQPAPTGRAEIGRLVALLANASPDGDDNDLPLILAAVHEVYEACAAPQAGESGG